MAAWCLTLSVIHRAGCSRTKRREKRPFQASAAVAAAMKKRCLELDGRARCMVGGRYGSRRIQNHVYHLLLSPFTSENETSYADHGPTLYLGQL